MEKSKDVIRILWNSVDFDREGFLEWNNFLYSKDLDRIIECLTSILNCQYGEQDSANIFKLHKTEDICDFLNRLISAKLENRKSAGTKNFSWNISKKELEEFKQLAEQTAQIPKEELAKTAPVLTTRSYLKMCRIAYDAIHTWDYPEDISTVYLYCEARLFGFLHEYENGILGCDWDSPEQFARNFNVAYHNEELFFGGPYLSISDESVGINRNVSAAPMIYSRWVGYIGCKPYFEEKTYHSVKMYIVLRMKGYPVYYPEYEKVICKLKERFLHD